ncbi:MAG: 7-cyano-7-deazaguanine synthase [Romboutsia sp.]|nr:7-cyano-7-deazaguanine synthase [Romboutsia sp.]
MKACVLYSGGKDSSLMGLILKKLGYDVELVTVNFGIYDSYKPAAKSAEALNIKHVIYKMDKNILETAVDMIIEDGFPNNGIKYLHDQVLENIAREYKVIGDGTRRDDRTPKLDKNQIKSLEDRHDIQYVNLDSFGYKMIKSLVSNFFELSYEKSNKDTSSDYEVEIRLLIDKKGIDSNQFFPEHYQTNVIGLKE